MKKFMGFPLCKGKISSRLAKKLFTKHSVIYASYSNVLAKTGPFSHQYKIGDIVNLYLFNWTIGKIEAEYMNVNNIQVLNDINFISAENEPQHAA